MIEIVAKKETKNGKEGVDLNVKIEGTSIEIGSEVLAIIYSLMKEVRDNDLALHLNCLMAIRENPWILSGRDEPSDDVEADLMARAMSKMTDKSVIS